MRFLPHVVCARDSRVSAVNLIDVVPDGYVLLDSIVKVSCEKLTVAVNISGHSSSVLKSSCGPHNLHISPHKFDT